jgi:outer membrane protein assembly factor BamB
MCLGFSIALCATASAVALDWPQWRGSNRDAKVTGFNAPETWPQELSQKWKVQVGDGVSTPALVGDRLYVFARQEADEVMRCLDANTGREIWKDQYESEPADGPARSYAGPRSSPTVADGKVVTYGARGVLSCYDTETGKVIWRKSDYTDSLPRFYTSSSPIIVEGLCIAQLGGEKAGAIVAYDLASGNETWKWSGDGTAYASPVLLSIDGTSIVIAETDDNIVGLEVSAGQVVWETPYAVSGRGYNAATPILDGQTIIYTGSNRGAIAARISKQGDALTAQELWNNQDNSVQYNTPVLKDGLLYGLSNRNVLFCINAETGKTLWTDTVLAGGASQGGGQRQQADRRQANSDQQPDAGGRRRGRRGGGRSRGGYGSIVDAGSVLFALTPAAQLIVFQPSETEFKQIASYKVSDGGTYAYPIVAGNRLFVKDANSVALWSFD